VFCAQLEREKLRAQMVLHYQETKSQEHQCILARHKIIEDRKEYLERLNTVRVCTEWLSVHDTGCLTAVFKVFSGIIPRDRHRLLF
jgi:hypothetical protein